MKMLDAKSGMKNQRFWCMQSKWKNKSNVKDWIYFTIYLWVAPNQVFVEAELYWFEQSSWAVFINKIVFFLFFISSVKTLYVICFTWKHFSILIFTFCFIFNWTHSLSFLKDAFSHIEMHSFILKSLLCF